jgi:hypothetical protein
MFSVFRGNIIFFDHVTDKGAIIAPSTGYGGGKQKVPGHVLDAHPERFWSK